MSKVTIDVDSCVNAVLREGIKKKARQAVIDVLSSSAALIAEQEVEKLKKEFEKRFREELVKALEPLLEKQLEKKLARAVKDVHIQVQFREYW